MKSDSPDPASALTTEASQSGYAQREVRHQPATLHYVDLSDHATISANPVQSRPLTSDQSEASNATVVVKLDRVIHPHLSGLGGAFNEIGGEAFMSLPKASRKRLAQALFNPESGSGMTLCRTAVGSSDFGMSAYSYSEIPEDYDMMHFSVARDKETVLAFINAAQKENSGLHIFASPWSPPGWMKESGQMDGGDRLPDTSILKSDPKIYRAYALYFAKYIQGYAAHGVEVKRLIIQNEPDVDFGCYPCCNIPPDQMSELAFSYIKPALEEMGLETELWAGSFRALEEEDARRDAQTFMKLRGAEVIDGLALQYCEPGTLRELQAKYPSMNLMHSEGACSNGGNSMEVARGRFSEIATWLNGGTENFCYWNMVLNETQSSAWDWKQNSLVTINRKTGDVRYNPDYGPISLLSRFIRPGDKSLRIIPSEGMPAIAVRNNDDIVVFLQNDAEETVRRSVDLSGRKYTVDLPKQSICAVVFKAGV